MTPIFYIALAGRIGQFQKNSGFDQLGLCSSVLLPLLNNAAGEAIASVETTECDCVVSVLWSSLFHGKHLSLSYFKPCTEYKHLLFAVPRNQLQSVAAACKVLIEFSLLRLENPDEACAVSQVSTDFDRVGKRKRTLESNSKIFALMLHNITEVLKYLVLWWGMIPPGSSLCTLGRISACGQALKPCLSLPSWSCSTLSAAA